MSITVYNYIDPNAYTSNATADSIQAPSQENVDVTANQESFEDALNAARKAVVAVAIDQLVTASNTGQVDANQVQNFFDQHGINIKLTPENISGNTTAESVNSTNSNSATNVYASKSYNLNGRSPYSQSDDYSNAGNLSCSDELEEIFQQAADTYGVDIKLLKAIGKQESNYDPLATSSSGAMGVMQLMPAAASDLDVENPYNSFENIMGGAKLISKLLDKYNGDTSLALAAYNAGSGNVDKYGGIPPFTETQNYVEKVLGYYNS